MKKVKKKKTCGEGCNPTRDRSINGFKRLSVNQKAHPPGGNPFTNLSLVGRRAPQPYTQLRPTRSFFFLFFWSTFCSFLLAFLYAPPHAKAHLYIYYIHTRAGRLSCTWAQLKPNEITEIWGFPEQFHFFPTTTTTTTFFLLFAFLMHFIHLTFPLATRPFMHFTVGDHYLTMLRATIYFCPVEQFIEI